MQKCEKCTLCGCDVITGGPVGCDQLVFCPNCKMNRKEEVAEIRRKEHEFWHPGWANDPKYLGVQGVKNFDPGPQGDQCETGYISPTIEEKQNYDEWESIIFSLQRLEEIAIDIYLSAFNMVPSLGMCPKGILGCVGTVSESISDDLPVQSRVRSYIAAIYDLLQLAKKDLIIIENIGTAKHK